MAAKDLPSIETLRKLLAYDPETGSLTWLPRPVSMFSDGKQSPAHNAAKWNAKYAGRPAFNVINPGGYLKGRFLGQNLKAHRVAWAIFHGKWPDFEIDHINRYRSDNRISNLRDVSHKENCRNQSMPETNTSGVVGVYFHAAKIKWQAQIKVSGQKKHLGYFTDFSAASAARKAAEVKYGFHEGHGR